MGLFLFLPFLYLRAAVAEILTAVADVRTDADADSMFAICHPLKISELRPGIERGVGGECLPLVLEINYSRQSAMASAHIHMLGARTHSSGGNLMIFYPV